MSFPPLFGGVHYLESLNVSLPAEAVVLEPDASKIKLPSAANSPEPAASHLMALALPGVKHITAPDINKIKLPEINNYLSRKFTSGFADMLSPVTDAIGAVLPYASTAFRLVNLIGSFFKKEANENTLPPLPYGKDFGLITYNMQGKEYRFSSDLVISEEHKRTAQLFTHPIEDGSEIADHILLNPKILTVVMLLTNFSIKRPGDSYVENHAENSYEILETAQMQKCLCSFQSSITKYRDYAIEELGFTRDKDAGDAIIVHISFKQAEVAKSATAVVDVLVGISMNAINISPLGETANTGYVTVGEF
jgi:hypothetical protein